ncbi:hypothetical protein QBC34DRAFT_97816 [Podospora aff. communis PSN243]|uniref:C2H2-type domain-containing protein n=1 Tax=Podospora aff. communis PSN243 TaxID=3040156 RepID=A0AAV9GMU7_9PEZI|nr:hypothetical protein QBC34DRAFT_97816 [Podospora aff. communis PSN243]
MDPSDLFQLLAQGFPELGDVVRREVESLLKARDTSNHSMPGSQKDCLFAAIEAYVSLVLSLLPKLAERLANGSLMFDYINRQMAEVDEATDFSDFTHITLLSEKQRGLRLLVERLQGIVDDFNNNKTPFTPTLPRSSAPPQPFNSFSASPPFVSTPSTQRYLVGTPLGLHSHSVTKISGSPSNFDLGSSAFDIVGPGVSPSASSPQRGSGFPDTSSDRQRLVPLSLGGLSELAQRGKGQHTCPQAFQCTKGGVNADGSMVIFERNSAFRAHLQKHEKPFKCDLPGCANHSGFARIDQLLRHKAMARHGQHNKADAL